MSNWNANSIQIVWFTADARHLKAGEMFQLITGEEAETTQNNKAPTPFNPNLSVASGVIADKMCSVTVQVGRVDFTLQAPNVSIEAGSFEDTRLELTWMADVGKRMGSQFAGLSRLALVTNLVNPRGSHAEATQEVNSILGNPVKFDDSSDLLFQVNRRSNPFGSGGVALNRFLRFAVMGQKEISLTDNIATAESFASSLMIDLNTVPTATPLSSVMQERIWDVLLTTTFKIREDGTLKALEG